MSEYTRDFGRHIRGMRCAREMTQGVLAERSGLSEATIRRIENGSFAASIETVRKACSGLGVTPGTVFDSFEGRADQRRELVDLIASRDDDDIALAIRVVRALFDELDILRNNRK